MRSAIDALADLAPDARQVWDSLADPPDGSDDVIHSRLHATLESLRQSRKGIALHAGAVVTHDGNGILFPAHTRSGKSTLVLALCLRSEAAFVSDDHVWLTDGSMTAVGAPIAVRRESPFRHEVETLTSSPGGERVLILPAAVGGASTQYSAQVDLIVFPAYGSGPASTKHLSPAETFCRVVGSLFEKPSEPELLQIAQLAVACPAATISYATVRESLDLVAELNEAPPTPQPCDNRIEFIEPARLEGTGLRADIRGLKIGDDTVVWAPMLDQIAYLSGWEGQHLSLTEVWSTLSDARLLTNAMASP